MLHLLSLISAAAGVSCPTYTCGSSSSTSLQCIDYSLSSGVDTYKITPCELSYQCEFKAQQSSSCQNYPASSRYPGEYCSVNLDCKSGNCKGNACQGIPQNSESNCTSTADCEAELFCSKGKCVSVGNKGEDCTLDEECTNDCLCDMGTCVQMFSLDLHEQTNTTWNYLAPLCSTGFAVKEGDAWNCSVAPQSADNQSVVECPESGVCTAKDGKTTRPCECGYDGKKYCPLFEGDAQVVSMISSWKKLFENSIHTCNGLRRWSYACFVQINSVAFENYLAWALNASLYLDGVWYKQINSKDCIDQTLLLDFTDLEEEYNMVKNNYKQCTAYSSVSKPSAWAENQCSYYSSNIYSDHKVEFYMTTKCPSGQYCQTAPQNNGTCQAKPTPTAAYPGQYCKLATECLSSNCTNNRCQGVTKNNTCDAETKLCNPGLYCNSTSKLCEDVNAYPTCEADLNCNSSSLCLFGKCTLKFSLPNGQSTVLKTGSTFGYSEACTSGFGHDSNATGEIVCAPAPVSNGKLFESCRLGVTTTDSTGTYIESCVCGLGGQGTFPLYVGDGGLINKIISNFKSLASKTSCYLNQWNVECVKHSDSLLAMFYEYNLNYLNLTSGAYYYKADDITLQAYNSEFYDALVYIRDEESSSSSSASSSSSSSSFGQVLAFTGISLFILA